MTGSAPARSRPANPRPEPRRDSRRGMGWLHSGIPEQAMVVILAAGKGTRMGWSKPSATMRMGWSRGGNYRPRSLEPAAIPCITVAGAGLVEFQASFEK